VASWRDRVSEPAQEDLDGLLDTALTLAEGRLETTGAFAPFALVVKVSGVTDMVALPPMTARQAQQMSYEVLGGMRSEIRAAAVVLGSALPESGTEAIDVFLEHAEGIALNVLEPYRLDDDGEVITDGLEAHTVRRRIWN
jgi:hypothetical protein